METATKTNHIETFRAMAQLSIAAKGFRVSLVIGRDLMKRLIDNYRGGE